MTSKILYNGDCIEAWELSAIPFTDDSEVNPTVMALFLREEYEQALEQSTDNKKMALTDSLTGLPNRAACELYIKDSPNFISIREHNKVLKTKKSNDRQSKTETGVLLLDLNGFKKVNDSAGHESGDDVLKIMARRLKEALPRLDTKVCRWGGDEFVIVVRNTTEADLEKTKDHIQKEVFKDFIYRHENQAYPIGAAIGAHVIDFKESLSANMAVADVEMYKAKQGNSNSRLSEEVIFSAPNFLKTANNSADSVVYSTPKLDLMM